LNDPGRALDIKTSFRDRKVSYHNGIKEFKERSYSEFCIEQNAIYW